jgi:histone H3/H4
MAEKDAQDAETKEKQESKPEKPAEQEEDVSAEEEEKLPFPNAAIVRLMKQNMDGEKMIKKEVKLAMNRWLGNLCVNVARQMNKFPYVMMHLHEFQKATETYTNMENFQREKERILAHLDAIKKDIERLERDLGKKDEEVF